MKEKMKAWMYSAGLQALKQACCSMAAMLGASVLLSEVNWLTVLSAGALSMIVSLLTSFKKFPEDLSSDNKEEKETKEKKEEKENGEETKLVPLRKAEKKNYPCGRNTAAFSEETVICETYTTVERVTEYRRSAVVKTARVSSDFFQNEGEERR